MPGRRATDVAGAHQPAVARHLGVRRVLAQGADEEFGHAGDHVCDLICQGRRSSLGKCCCRGLCDRSVRRSTAFSPRRSADVPARRWCLAGRRRLAGDRARRRAADLSVVATGASVGLVGAVLFGGVAADRIPQKRILVAVEASEGGGYRHRRRAGAHRCVQIWHLAVVSFVLGVADGFFYPAYSALAAGVLPAEELLAANGIEGMLRPTVMQAGGPGAGRRDHRGRLARRRHGDGRGAQLLAVVGAADRCAPRPSAASSTAPRTRSVAVLGDLRDGFRYMVRTPWLLGTLLFATGAGAGDHGPDRGAAAVRRQGPDRRRCRARSRWPSAPSASAGRSDRWWSPRCRYPAGT